MDNGVIRHEEGGAWEDHKYIARVEVKGSGNKKNKYRYFYTRPEYQSYLSNKQKTASPTNKFAELLSKGKSILDSLVKKVDTVSDDVAKKGEKTVDSIFTTSEKKVKEIAEKVEKTVKEADKKIDKLVEKAEKSVPKSVKNTTKAVEKAVDKAYKETVNKGEKTVLKALEINGDVKVNPGPEVGANVGDHVSNVVSNLMNGFLGNSLSINPDLIIDYLYPEDESYDDEDEKDDEPRVDGYENITEANEDEIPFLVRAYLEFSEEEYCDYLERLAYQDNEPDFMDDIPDIPEDKAFTKFEDQEKVNEAYDYYDDGSSTENCSNCSAAYELRRRGYDVEAELAPPGEYYNGRGDRVYDYFEDAELIAVYGDGSTMTHDETFMRKLWDEELTYLEANTKYKDDYNFQTTPQSYTPESIEKAILDNNPPGSRGFIDVEWANSDSAHSIVYEVDTKGNVTIRDSQTWDEYDLNELADRVDKVRIARTDNLELKEEILSAVKPNEDKKRKYYVDENYLYEY